VFVRQLDRHCSLYQSSLHSERVAHHVSPYSMSTLSTMNCDGRTNESEMSSQRRPNPLPSLDVLKRPPVSTLRSPYSKHYQHLRPASTKGAWDHIRHSELSCEHKKGKRHRHRAPCPGWTCWYHFREPLQRTLAGQDEHGLCATPITKWSYRQTT